MKTKAIIISIKSDKLSKNERSLLTFEKPWGLILFNRNITSLSQVKKLISQIRKITKDPKFPILIDEEGKTVSRLRKIISHDVTQKIFGDMYKHQPKSTAEIYKAYVNSLCKFLNIIGVNINTVPVLDVLRKETCNII